MELHAYIYTYIDLHTYM